MSNNNFLDNKLYKYTHKKGKTSLKFLHYFSIFLIIFIIISSGISMYFNVYIYRGNGPNVFLGLGESTVVTGSMTPTICKNDVILINRWSSFDNVKEGDIIVYKGQDNYGNSINVVHRVVHVIKNQGLILKGDNNDVQDNVIVTEDMYIGKYVKVLNSFEIFSCKMLPVISSCLILGFGIVIIKTKKYL